LIQLQPTMISLSPVVTDSNGIKMVKRKNKVISKQVTNNDAKMCFAKLYAISSKRKLAVTFIISKIKVHHFYLHIELMYNTK